MKNTEFNRSKWMSDLNKEKNKEKAFDINRDILYDLYINQQKSYNECAAYFNCSRSVIASRIKKYGIKLSKEQRSLRLQKKPEVSKEELVELYINQNKSQKEITDILSITRKQLTTILNKYNIRKPKELERANYRKTMIEKYGVTNSYAASNVKEKIKHIIQEKYGVDYACELPQAKEANKPYKISKINIEYSNYLKDNNIDNELEYDNFDIKIKNKNIVLEINPTYTHNTTNRAKFGNFIRELIEPDYHLNKTKKANKNGLLCIHIFDWDNINKIIYLLKDKSSIYARLCEIKEVSLKEANDFLNLYHLQSGLTKQEVCLGLYYNNELIEIMTFGKPRYNKNYEYELLRLCTHKDYTITGGTQKLFKYFIDNYKPTSIISYCDISKFSGDVYERLGFSLKSTSKPIKHWYNIKTEQHVTDNLLRQRGFDQLFGTNYGKGTSNEELMIEYGFVEVYDCGQSTYIWTKEETNI